jgi:hypothetical protein
MKNIFLFAILIISTTAFSQNFFSVEKLKEHNTYLASDSLKGRKPGTAEDMLAAKYIRNEFKKYGLSLLGEEGFQYFDVQIGLQFDEESFVKIGKYEAKSKLEYIPFAFTANNDISAKAVFVGYGFDINDDDLKWNDYKDINVTGKWVIVLNGSPENNRHGTYGAYESVRSKVMNAEKYGAEGVIIVSGPNYDADDKLTDLKYSQGLQRTKIPVIQMKRELVDKIIKGSKLTTANLETEINSNLKPKSFETKQVVSAYIKVEYIELPTQNVVAILKTDNPEYADRYIVIGAHYDHLGFGGKGSGSRMPDTVAIHNGADDNASGVSSLLVLAKEFANCKTKPKRNIVFIAFGAEEMGLLGSKYFLDNPLIDIKKITVMLNIDMVGRLKDNGNNLAIIGTGTATEFEEILDNLKPNYNFKFSYNKSGYGGSDHASFYSKEIPVLFFNSGSESEYHTPFDDTELIDFEEQSQITDLVYKLAINFANREKDFTYQNTGTENNQKMTFKVTLGIMPSYSDSGNTGLKVDGVSKDGTADKAGILKNDIIVELDGTKITNIYDYMEVLKRLKSGQKTTVKVNRNNEVKTLDVHF